MSRIAATFTGLKAQGRKALIPFVTAGYPYEDVTAELMHAMVAGGADVIELGVPFSDPSADGPVIQKAGDKALAFGIGMVQVIAMVREFRKANSTTPVVLMGYANPVERYDQKFAREGVASAFVKDASEAGVDGVLIVDYPPEECVEFAAKLRAHSMDLIFLLAPTSTPERMGDIIGQPLDQTVFGLPTDRFCTRITADLLGADHPLARSSATPATTRFLSLEPLLGPIDLRLDECYSEEDCYQASDRLHVAIVGGESGPNARPRSRRCRWRTPPARTPTAQSTWHCPHDATAPGCPARRCGGTRQTPPAGPAARQPLQKV